MFGIAFITMFLLNWLNSHTNAGDFLNISKESNSVARYPLQSPQAPLYVGIPESADIPAPVITTMFLAFLSKLRNKAVSFDGS